MKIEEGLRYTESHEWIRIEGKEALIGITDYAQDSLGDIVFVEMPEIGTELSKGDEALNIESVKVAEAVYAPLTGRVTGVNTELADSPELINKTPYDHRAAAPSDLHRRLGHRRLHGRGGLQGLRGRPGLMLLRADDAPGGNI